MHRRRRPVRDAALHIMNPSRPFIERPVATALLMVAIVLSGLIGLRFLPISALPQVDYPTIQVQTLYPGGSPEVMSQTVTAPLERNLCEMAGLQRMSSVSAAGASTIVVKVSQDSWFSVRDKNGKEVFSGLVHAGDTKEVAGQAPFKIIAGNRAGLESMTLDGQPVEAAKFGPNKGNVARFTLP